MPVVVFQFDCNTPDDDRADGGAVVPPSNATQHQSDDDLNQSVIHKSIEKGANFTYFDKLNSWLGQNLQRDCVDVDFEIVDHPTHGTCIRYCPLELGLSDSVPLAEHLECVDASLDGQIEILRATVRHRGTLMRFVESCDVLRMVPLSEWAGLGGVRYVPDGWESLLTDQAKTELNKLNTDLVEMLQTTDAAFSMGEGADGMICIR